VKKALDMFCDRVPPHARDQIVYEYRFRGNAVTVYERRPPWRGGEGEWSKIPVARFKYDPEDQTWTLQCADRNSRWHVYRGFERVRRFQDLVDEVNRDRTGIFFG
jgi:hypothetical protein